MGSWVRAMNKGESQNHRMEDETVSKVTHISGCPEFCCFNYLSKHSRSAALYGLNF